MDRSQREAPAPDPLRGTPGGPSHPQVAEEPVLNVDNIQGNVVPGFMKDHQTLVFLRIDNPLQFQRWLRGRVATIATTAEVLTFNRLFKSIRARLNREPANLKVTWTNVAFTAEGLKSLGADTDQFFDEAFREGLAKRSPDLGDPTAAGAAGAVKNWLVLDGKDDRKGWEPAFCETARSSGHHRPRELASTGRVARPIRRGSLRRRTKHRRPRTRFRRCLSD